MSYFSTHFAVQNYCFFSTYASTRMFFYKKYLFWKQKFGNVKLLLYLCIGFEKIIDPPILADATSYPNNPEITRLSPRYHPVITPLSPPFGSILKAFWYYMSITKVV